MKTRYYENQKILKENRAKDENKRNLKEISTNKIKKFNHIIIFIFISVSIIKKIISQESNESSYSFLTLKISQGKHKIFSDGSGNSCTQDFTKPSEVYIEGENQSTVQAYYTFNNPVNNVKLVWKIPVTNCHSMFCNCRHIPEINLSQFNTSLVTNMARMFEDCRTLTTIDLSNIDTSNVLNMKYMFQNCHELTSLDLSLFDTSNTTDMSTMFNGCTSLKELNLSLFNTQKVQYMDNMFNGCTSLISLYFENINMSSVIRLTNMFYNNTKLEYVNIKNYISSKTLGSSYYFNESLKNLVVCTEDKDLITIIESHECNIVNCLDDWYNYRKKINKEGKCEDCHYDCQECEGPYTINNTHCISCSSPDKVLKFGNCINQSECLTGIYINETNNQSTCICDLEQCLGCSLESFNKNLCNKCEGGYFPFYDYNNEYFPYLNCTKSPIGYYLDNESSTYKLCYSSCETCEKSGNITEHNCKECKFGYNYEIHFGIYKNCYTNCTFYHYYDSGKSYCTKSNECENYFDKLIENKSECVSNCSEDGQYKYEFRKYCYEKCPPNSTLRKKVTEIEAFPLDKNYFCKPICYEEAPFEILNTQECVKYYDIKKLIDKSCILNYQNKKKENQTKDDIKEKIKANNIIINNIESGFTSEEFNTLELENGNNEVFQFEEMTISLTTTQNQKKDKDNRNITTIDFQNCEKILRDKYSIPDNKMLFMVKIDVIQEGMKIPKIEYNIYCQLNGSKMVKLDLSYCSNIKIDISIPIEITESLDKLNSSSSYYNDICYTTTSDSGTDIILNDRKTEYVEGNKTVCQENCIFSDYDESNQKAICSCDVVQSSFSFANFYINKTKLYENFVNFKNIANVNLLKCYKELFSVKGIKKNYGCISLIPLILIHFIIIILFYGKNLYKTIEDKINDISYGIANLELIQEEDKEKKMQERLKSIQKRKERLKKTKEEGKNKNKNYKKKKMGKIVLQKESHPPSKKSKKKGNKSVNLINNNNNIININNKKKDKISNIIESITQLNKQKNKTESNDNKKEKVRKLMEYSAAELNNLKYKLASKYDHRSFCQYYISLLKTKHIIIFTFFNNNDHNSKIIKIDLFLFNFSLYYAVNALFFNDNTMHHIYQDKGTFDIVYQLPQIAYSSIISTIINILLKILALSQDLILDFKQQKEKNDLDKKVKVLNNKLKIKLTIYFLLSTLLFIFFWYYISMFCTIYVNTQLHLIKDTLISFGLTLLYPFGINLIPGLFRIPALSKSKRKYLYNLSLIIQMI